MPKDRLQDRRFAGTVMDVGSCQLFVGMRVRNFAGIVPHIYDDNTSDYRGGDDKYTATK
jgi:hypothetical protein